LSSRGYDIVRILRRFTVLIVLILSFENCVAWPGFSAAVAMLSKAGSGSSIPPLLFPGSNQAQDNPTSSDDTSQIAPPTEDSNVVPAPLLIVDSRSGWTVSESGSKVSFRIRLSRQPSDNVSFENITMSISDEIKITPSVITVTPALWNIDTLVEIEGLPDSIQDGNQLIDIQLNQATSTDLDFNNLEGGIVSVSNVDTDTAGVSISPMSSVETSEAGASQNLTILLSSKPTSSVSFPVIVSNSSEASADRPTVTFSTSNWNIPQTLTITGQDDSSVDGNVPYTIQLGSASSADATYNGMSSGTVNAVNNDNDSAGISITTVSVAPWLTSESSGAITYSVKLTSKPSSSVTLSIFSLSPLEGQPSLSSMVFTNLNWNTSQSLVVTGQDDPDIDGDKSYTVQISVSGTTDSNYASILPTNLGFTNIDNDTAGFVFQNHLSRTTSEDGTNTSFQVKLRSRPTDTVTLNVLSSDTTEGTVSSSSLVFNTSNWNTYKTVQINPVNESLLDGDQFYEIQFPSVVSTDSNYNGLVVGNVPVQNLDDDTPGVMFYNSASMITTEATSAGWTFQMRLKTKPNASVTFPMISVSNSNEGTLSLSTITFSTTDWNVPRSIKITPVRDWIADPDTTYSISFLDAVSTDTNYNGFVAAPLSVLNKNSDTRGYIYNPTTPALFVADSGRIDQFTVRLNSKPDGIVRLPITSYDLSQMTIVSGTLEFNASNWNTPTTIQVAGVEDGIVDGTKTARLGIGVEVVTTTTLYYPEDVPSISDPTYNTVALTDRNGSTRGILSVRACDSESKITICSASSPTYQTSEAGGTVTLYYALGQAPSDDVTINITSSNTAEGVVNVSSLVFTPTNWRNLQSIVVTGVDDTSIDGTINYSLQYSVVSSDSNYNAFSITPTAFRNTDNDSAGIVLNVTNSTSSPYITTRVPGPKNTYTFSIRLSARPTDTVQFNLNSNNLSEGTLNLNSLTFSTADWNVPQSVTIQAVDTGSTAITNYKLIAGPFVSTDTKFSVLANREIQVRNTSPGFEVTPPSTQTGEWGSTANFVFKLTSPPLDTITIRYYSELETEGLPYTGTLITASSPLYPASVPPGTKVRYFTRSASNWSSATSYSVIGVDDDVLDGSQDFRIIFLPIISNDATYNGLIPSPITITNQDND
jgi:hypothetical protein